MDLLVANQMAMSTAEKLSQLSVDEQQALCDLVDDDHPRLLGRDVNGDTPETALERQTKLRQRLYLKFQESDLRLEQAAVLAEDVMDILINEGMI